MCLLVYLLGFTFSPSFKRWQSVFQLETPFLSSLIFGWLIRHGEDCCCCCWTSVAWAGTVIAHLTVSWCSCCCCCCCSNWYSRTSPTVPLTPSPLSLTIPPTWLTLHLEANCLHSLLYTTPILYRLFSCFLRHRSNLASFSISSENKEKKPVYPQSLAMGSFSSSVDKRKRKNQQQLTNS